MTDEDYPNVTVDTNHIFALEVWDNHTGEQLVDESLVDHIELSGGKLTIEVNSEEPLP